MGYAVRGMYGEGSKSIGAFYQISNEATLGQSEEEILDHTQSVIRQIIKHERDARNWILDTRHSILDTPRVRGGHSITGKDACVTRIEHPESSIQSRASRIEIEDKIFRSYGILANARSISSKEALELLSWVSLGVNTGMLLGPSITDITRLLVLIRPAHLQKYEGRELDTAARDVTRAAVIRKMVVNK
jgi:protein arginine kinase